MRLVWKSLAVHVAIVTVALCVGATAMYAWNARAIKVDKPVAARSSMSGFFDVHDKAHLDNLPVQIIENYN
jgi:hypothetical protein